MNSSCYEAIVFRFLKTDYFRFQCSLSVKTLENEYVLNST